MGNSPRVARRAGAGRRILDQTHGLTILVSTVAAWYSSEKDERLNVHRIHPDCGDKSRLDQLKGKLQQYLTPLSEGNRRKRIVSIRTRDVVDAQLLKSIIAVADYDSPTEETVTYRTEFPRAFFDHVRGFTG